MADLSLPASTPSAFAGTAGNEVFLPAFVLSLPDGLCIDPRQLAQTAELTRFIDHVYAAGFVFDGLRVAALDGLLYPPEPTGAPVSPRASAPVLIARGLRPFPPERQALYKGVKLVDRGARAEYFFEPVSLIRQTQRPLVTFDATGEPVIGGYETVTEEEPARLDVDEFVAVMWVKGVRAGLLPDVIRAAIEAGTSQRLTIARRIAEKVGADATLKEETDTLHRDDSPAILPNGRVDLRHFKNHFPQVKSGTLLLRKVPRRFGECGREISGAAIEPPPPRDFDIETIAGPGSRVGRTAEGEFIFAARDGFIHLDTQTQQISVTEKIVNRAGVSLRTTGDLSLSGDEFEEHGEVQEKRVVEGLHMSFHADVFGRIVSRGGRVHLHAAFAGGRIDDPQGRVVIEGRATRALIDASGGEVAVNQAEGVGIIARCVHIRRAVACSIVADEVTIGEAFSCAIHARHVRILRAATHRGVDMQIVIVTPDLAALDKRIAQVKHKVTELEQQHAVRQAEMEQRAAAAEVRSYLKALEYVESGAAQLTAAQEATLRQAGARLARPLAELRALKTELAAQAARLGSLREELEALSTERTQAAAGVACQVENIAGETTVLTRSVAPGEPLCPDLTLSNMQQKLRDPRQRGECLFTGAQGRLAWVWEAPAAPA